MIPRDVKAPTVAIPFHKLLKIVAIVDRENVQTKELLDSVNFPVLPPEAIATAVVAAATASTTGTCWVCQPGRDPLPYEFRDVPGPRTEGAEGRRPPELREGDRFTT